MKNREKVILGFKCHFRLQGMSCTNCPYYNTNTLICQRQLELDALEILNELEPTEAKSEQSGGSKRTKTLFSCGACGARVSKSTSRFCSKCGRLVIFK